MALTALSELARASVAGAGAALLICLLRMPIARTIALVDEPDVNKRKTHTSAVPLIGGIALFPAIAIASVISVSTGAPDSAIAVTIGIIFGFFMIGYADDRMHIRPSRRLLLTLTLFAALVLTAPGYMPDKFTIGGIALSLGAGLIALLAIIGAAGALNAINMADGQDGLCSGLLLIWLVYLAFALPPSFQPAAIIPATALVIVLGFNMTGSIFLGDSGAYGVGSFVVALMLAGAGSNAIDHSQIVALLSVPVMDCILLMIERSRRGRSPFDPDRQHLHHILQKTFGKWPSLGVYLGVVALGAFVAAQGGWFTIAAIVGQIAFVTLARRYGGREPEIGDEVWI